MLEFIWSSIIFISRGEYLKMPTRADCERLFLMHVNRHWFSRMFGTSSACTGIERIVWWHEDDLSLVAIRFTQQSSLIQLLLMIRGFNQLHILATLPMGRRCDNSKRYNTSYYLINGIYPNGQYPSRDPIAFHPNVIKFKMMHESACKYVERASEFSRCDGQLFTAHHDFGTSII